MASLGNTSIGTYLAAAQKAGVLKNIAKYIKKINEGYDKAEILNDLWESIKQSDPSEASKIVGIPLHVWAMDNILQGNYSKGIGLATIGLYYDDPRMKELLEDGAAYLGVGIEVIRELLQGNYPNPSDVM